MKDKLLISILLFTQLSYSLNGQNNVKSIQIDVKRNDQLKLSSITSELVQVPLGSKVDLKHHLIWKVLLIDEYIYILEGSPENKGWSERVLKFDKKGKFISQIGYDIETKSYLKVNDIFVDEIKRILILKCDSFFRVYDYEGVYLYSLKAAYQANYYFNDHFFCQDIYIEGGCLANRLICQYIAGKEEKEIPIPPPNPELLGSKSTGRSFNYSEMNNQLYISFGYDLKIYKLNNFKLEPAYEFDFKNCILSSLNVPPAPKQIICGDYIQYGYWLKNSPYGQNIFIYNTRSDESYNIRLRYENGVLISGIEDDICDTGCIQMNKTNHEGYIFFTTNVHNVNGKVVDTNPVVFIVKLK